MFSYLLQEEYNLGASKDRFTDSNSVDGHDHLSGRESPSTCHIEMSLLPRASIHSKQEEKGYMGTVESRFLEPMFFETTF